VTGTAPFVAIVGATGTGKSALALDLVEELAALGHRAEIVNADAMQLYRGMDIGTAKVPVSDRRGIRHWLIDVLEPTEEASVANYQRDARATIDEIAASGATPILVGGSGLYAASVLLDYRFPPRDPLVRARLEAEQAELGTAALYERLAATDPAAAAVIDPRNDRRVIRALEVVELEGSFTPGMPDELPAWRPATTIWLRLERDRLVPRLDDRVVDMWGAGLVAEAAALRESPGLGATAAQAIGYAQALAQVDGRLSESEAIAETQALTRRYARRQVSWFKRMPDLAWVDAEADYLLEFAVLRALRED
jgi:tRNA dimethylallyltransferase